MLKLPIIVGLFYKKKTDKSKGFTFKNVLYGANLDKIIPIHKRGIYKIKKSDFESIHLDGIAKIEQDILDKYYFYFVPIFSFNEKEYSYLESKVIKTYNNRTNKKTAIVVNGDIDLDSF